MSHSCTELAAMVFVILAIARGANIVSHGGSRLDRPPRLGDEINASAIILLVLRGVAAIGGWLLIWAVAFRVIFQEKYPNVGYVTDCWLFLELLAYLNLSRQWARGIRTSTPFGPTFIQKLPPGER
jgi:hypothetical protein